MNHGNQFMDFDMFDFVFIHFIDYSTHVDVDIPFPYIFIVVVAFHASFFNT